MSQVYISGPDLRKRWAMANSTFYHRLALGTIPKPVHPFGRHKPYWRMADIEQFERAAEPAEAVAA